MNYLIDPSKSQDAVLEVSEHEFRNFLITAKQMLRRPLGLNLHLHPEGSHPGLRTFLTNDRESGVSVTPDGEMLNLFSLPKGRGDLLVAHAKSMGATHLDAYEGYLPSLYERNGFVEVDRVAWDDRYAPNGWDYSRSGRPDVVYMALPQ